MRCVYVLRGLLLNILKQQNNGGSKTAGGFVLICVPQRRFSETFGALVGVYCSLFILKALVSHFSHNKFTVPDLPIAES